MQLFVDLDGVLADFDQHYLNVFGVEPAKRQTFDADGHDIDWEAVRRRKNFYLDMPPMPDAHVLWAFVSTVKPMPKVLTGVPSTVAEAPGNKQAWVQAHLKPIPEVVTCRSSEKYKHARPGDILIDDWEKYKLKWERAGGVWITHRSASETIARLLHLGVGWR